MTPEVKIYQHSVGFEEILFNTLSSITCNLCGCAKKRTASDQSKIEEIDALAKKVISRLTDDMNSWENDLSLIKIEKVQINNPKDKQKTEKIAGQAKKIIAEDYNKDLQKLLNKNISKDSVGDAIYNTCYEIVIENRLLKAKKD